MEEGGARRKGKGRHPAASRERRGNTEATWERPEQHGRAGGQGSSRAPEVLWVAEFADCDPGR